MGQTTEQIESHIDRKRRALRSNLDELEGKVKTVTDWRQYVRRNPTAMLAVAFTGGLLAANLAGRRRQLTAASPADASDGGEIARDRKAHALRAWSNIQGALIATGAAKLQEKLGDIVPGFREHLEKVSADGNLRRRASETPREGTVQGEGDYRSAREYRQGVEKFVRTADIDRAAREAAPRDEREAAELEAAEDRGRRGTGHREGPEPGASRHS
jgi:hypothetical protein